MKNKRLQNLLITLMVMLLVLGYSNTEASNFINECISIEKKDEQPEINISYVVNKSEKNKSEPASVYIKGKEIITFSQTAGGVTPKKRAELLTQKLISIVKNKQNPAEIYPGFVNGIAVVELNGDVLLTVDVKSAKSNSLSVSRLALKWANSIRENLGAKRLIRDYSLIDSMLSSKNQNESAAKFQQTGVASWYGPYFHGRTAADGSIYNMNEFTAAHKSLPFGSVVKVTNLKNNESCIVKITDRGPFVGQRIIDLSKIAAEEIGMLHSGVSSVKIEVLGQV